ncbi:MAG: leucine-rich repeat domain-containing protein [Clostridia bacterium]|nr:leucine-rich repeat domain-containing protein [Clostridia bacterium]
MSGKNKNLKKEAPKQAERGQISSLEAALTSRRVMLPVIAVLAVLVLSLILLIVLDQTGLMYDRPGNGDDGGGSSVILGGESELLDGEIHTSGSYRYRLLKNGTVELYFFTDHTANGVVIPDKIDGRAVTVIGKECFVWMAALSSVSIPEGVVSIGESAFEGCGYLVSVSLPSTLVNVADNAFLNCPSTMNVTYKGDASALNIGKGNVALTDSLSKGSK